MLIVERIKSNLIHVNDFKANSSTSNFILITALTGRQMSATIPFVNEGIKLFYCELSSSFKARKNGAFFKHPGHVKP
jgi:ascorbate-specific PTS system EIIC-type component UlaA